MLIIYGALTIGGVETYFLRIAKERFRLGLKTKILLQYPDKSNKELFNEISKYVTIYNYGDISDSPSVLEFMKMTAKLNPVKVAELLNGIELIHTFKGEDALLAYRFTRIINNDTPISVGFYNYFHYLWGGKNVPYFEKINRDFVLKYLPKNLLMLFTMDNIELHSSRTGIDFSNSQTFSIGVVDSIRKHEKLEHLPKVLKICTVGRLVAHKYYNLTLIEAMRDLVDSGVNVKLDIYGNGPLEATMNNRVKELGLIGVVSLKGEFDYSRFDETVSKYDMFFGTGTAIVQASSLGVPAVACLDNTRYNECYGYFTDIFDRQYGRNDLKVKRISATYIITEFLNLELKEINALRELHCKCVERFLIDSSVASLNSLKHEKMPSDKFSRFYSIAYDATRLIHHLRLKVDKRYFRLRNSIDY